MPDNVVQYEPHAFVRRMHIEGEASGEVVKLSDRHEKPKIVPEEIVRSESVNLLQSKGDDVGEKLAKVEYVGQWFRMNEDQRRAAVKAKSAELLEQAAKEKRDEADRLIQFLPPPED